MSDELRKAMEADFVQHCTNALTPDRGYPFPTDHTAKIIAEQDQRIAELEARVDQNGLAYGVLWVKNEAMAALLDRVPHDYAHGPPSAMCTPDCPACAWSRLKACE